MDVIKSMQGYVDKMVGSSSVSGMKVLLLDPETKGIVGMVYTMSEILEKEVYLVETIDATHEPMMHLKALCYLRPSEANMSMLKVELAKPKYSEYHIFFSNIVPHEYLRKLAEADEHSVVKQVQEFYGDYYAVNPDYFTLNLGQTLALSQYPRVKWTRTEELNFNRSVQGIVSLLLSLKQRPYVRYGVHSEASQVFAREVVGRLDSERELFDFRKRDGGSPLLLILDRRDDPVTPLLTQWTYQAMVHELLGLRNNRVNMAGMAGVTKDKEEVVLACDQDEFFRSHMYNSFGELGVAVKTIMEEYQSERKTHENISSIEDMQSFVENFPELRKKSNTVGKHVQVMSQLVSLVNSTALMDVSAIEQEVACANEQSSQYREIVEIMDNPSVGAIDALRLVMLYALRYQTVRSNNLDSLKRLLQEKKGLTDHDVSLVGALLKYGGVEARGGDLFGNKSFMKAVASTVKRGVKGVENVFTQHTPLLAQTLERLNKNKLSKTLFPYMGSEAPGRLSSVVVFIVGGTTYEEATKVAAINAAGVGPRIILGGTCVHNSKSFIDDLASLGPASSGLGMDEHK